MKAECVICMEHFQSSDAISASQCGHVFHEACIARWLRESGGRCPQCRSIISKVLLTRLFFTESSPNRATTTTTATTSSQSDIDTLQARIVRAKKSIEELRTECRLKTAKIEELTKARRKQETDFAKLTLTLKARDKSLRVQTKKLE